MLTSQTPESTFFDDFQAAIQEAVDDRPETAGRLDEERQYLTIPAPNAIRWCVDPNFGSMPSLYDYTRSYQVIRDVFQLRCPICNPRSGGDCWGKPRAVLDAESLLEWSAKHEEDVCPKCGTTRSEFEDDGLLKRINALHLVCGQRSGKSIVAGMIGTYVEHRILTIAHSTPGGFNAHLGLTIKDPSEITFLASNEVQGQDTIWAKYRAMRADAPWFKRYVSWVKSQEAKQDTPPGMERWVYSESNRKIINEHPDCKFIINSLNSNSAGLRGRTRIFGGLDEVSHMQGGESRFSGDEIFRSVENSLQTVRSRTKRVGSLPWLGLLASVTSPLSKDDKGMRLLRAPPDSMLTYHLPTWEFNPFEPRENFDALYQKDPVGTERDFGANPPMAAHPLIHDVGRFHDLVIDHTLEPACQFDTPMFTESGHAYIGIKVKDLRPRFSRTHFIAFDAGKNFDAFAGACAHGEVYLDPETGAQRTRTVFDWVFRILPQANTEVYYDDVYGVVKGLMQSMPVQCVEFDRWNSTQLIQQIRRAGIDAEQKSLKNEDWVRFRQDAYAGVIAMFPPAAGEWDKPSGEYLVDPPSMHPHTCALYELERLEEDPDTQKVYNPHKGLERGFNSNDTAQVVVHAHKMVQDVGYTERMNDRSRDARRKRAQAGSQDFMRHNMGGVYNVSRMGGGPRDWGRGRGW